MTNIGLRAALAVAILGLLTAASAPTPRPTAERSPSAGAAPRLSPDQAIPAGELEAMVDVAVRQAMDHDHIAGVTVAVVQDGRVVLAKGYGFADIERGRPVDPDRTLFRVGSITKTFTWLMSLDAVEHGRMSLDAPVNTYLPPKVRVPDHPGFRQVELRDLMTHTPGFEDLVLKHLFSRDPAKLRSLDDDLAAYRPARMFPPGEVTAYSNYGAALAGDALAHAEVLPWEDLLETRILKPAGLEHTTGREIYPPRASLPDPMPASLQQDVSKGYRWTGARYTADPFELVGGNAPAGAISSSAGDMARYMTLLLNGGVIDGRTIYGPGAAAAIRTPMKAYPGGAGIDGGVFQGDYGNGLISYGHNGATVDFHSNLMIVPALRLGVFVASNTEGEMSLTGVLPGRIVQTFYQAPQTPLPAAPRLLGASAIYQGEYITMRRPFHGLEAFAMGLRTEAVSVVPPGYLVIDGERFVPASQTGVFQDVDHPQVQFQAVVSQGRAQKLLLTGGELWRLDLVHQTRTIGIATVATLVASIGVLFGLFSVARWRLPQTRVQRIASALRGPAAILWLIAVAAFAMKFQAAITDQSTVVFDWPGPMMLASSIIALAAAVLSWTAAALTPFAWAGRDGWSASRKLRFTATIVVFSAFGLLLAILGALQPWNP